MFAITVENWLREEDEYFNEIAMLSFLARLSDVTKIRRERWKTSYETALECRPEDRKRGRLRDFNSVQNQSDFKGEKLLIIVTIDGQNEFI